MVTSTPITCPVGTVADARKGLCVPTTFLASGSGSGSAGVGSTLTHASSPLNKPSVSGSGSAGAGSSGSAGVTLSSPPFDLSSNCIPQIPIPCWGIIAAGVAVGAIILFKVL